MFSECKEDCGPRRLIRWAGMLMAAGVLLCAAPVLSSARAGNIFDDDWPPPKAVKPAAPPAITSATKPAPAPKPEVPLPPTQAPTTVTVAPTTLPSLARRALPSPADQAKSRKLFREIFASELADRSPAGRRALAARLLEQAASVGDTPADQFVLLVGAIEAAEESSDLPLCFRAADALATAYEVDGLRLKSDSAIKSASRADLAAAADNCAAGLGLVDQLVAVEDYADAGRVLQSLRATTREAALSSQIQKRVKEIETLRAATERVAPFLQKLKATPDDAAANLAAGQYFCFTRDDWKQGLPLLVKSRNTGLGNAAALDLAEPTEAEKQVAVGDAWWAIAETENGAAQAATRQRAARWYGLALHGGKVAGLQRVLLEKRVAAAPPVAVSAASGQHGTAARGVLWFHGDGLEEALVRGISGGKVKVVENADTAAVLADPRAYADIGIVLWGNNRWRETPAEVFTDGAQQGLQRFVRDGGDLVMFYQFGAGHMEIIDKLFGVKTEGASGGAQIMVAELKTRAAQAGYTDDTLKKINFFNSYSKLPKDATVLIRDGGGHDAVVVVPFGKGRLILIGTGMGAAPRKLVEEVFEGIYHWKAGKR